MAKNKLSIYLLKEGVTESDIMVDRNGESDSPRYHLPIETAGGKFYWRSNPPSTPKWIDGFFGADFECPASLQTKTAQGVFVKKIRVQDDEERWFAICFGGGHNLLRQENLEPHFGFFATLNVIDPESLRAIDITTMESNPLNSRLQASRKTEIGLMGIDFERDLIKAVTGKSKDGSFSTNVTGKTSLNITNEANANNGLDDILKKAYQLFKSEDYRANFDQINNIIPIKDRNLSKELDSELIRMLNDRNLDNIWIGPPEVMDWEGIQGFKMPLGNDVETDLEIPMVLGSMRFRDGNNGVTNVIPDANALKGKRISVVSASDGNTVKSWNVYRCLNCEMSKDGVMYILNDGNWYELNADFVRSVNEYYERIPLTRDIDFCDFHAHEDLPEGGKYGEGQYNKQLRDHLNNAVLMDAKNISHGGGRSKIEMCDVMTEDRRHLIHVKQYSGSSAVLSHLFSQGVVSGELLRNDDEFIRKANEKISNQAQEVHLPEDRYLIGENFNDEDHEIVYAIVTDKDVERPQIPFFSKITLKRAHKLLKAMKYNVSIKNIRIS